MSRPHTDFPPSESINPQAECNAWNAQYPVGQRVHYANVLGDPPKEFMTRTEAQVLSGHTAVVWLTGKSGCVCLSHCTPLVTQV